MGLTNEQAAALGATDADSPDVSPEVVHNVADRRPLSHAEAAGLGATEHMSTPEAAARLLYKHGTLGFSPGASREKEEIAEQEHPYLNVGTGAAAMLGQTALLGPVAGALKGVEGANLLAQAARGTGKAIEYAALPNTEARTAFQTGRTAAKLGSNYSMAETAGHDLTSPDKSWLQTGADVAGTGIAGAAIGFPLGVGAHGVGRMLASTVVKRFPHFDEVRAAAKQPNTAGAREIMDDALLDKYKPADFEGLKAALADPEQAHNYQGLNLIEALERYTSGGLRPNPITGELQMPPRLSTNLRRAEQDAAQMPGEGAHEAITKYATRRTETSGNIQQDLERLLGNAEAADANAVGPAVDRLGAGYARAPTHAELPGHIERAFGASSADAAASEAAETARRAQFDKRFGNMRKSPPVFTTEMATVVEKDPMLRAAVADAAQKAEIRAARAAVENPDAAAAMTPYTQGVRTAESEALAGRLAEGLRTGKVPPEVAAPAGGHGTGFNIFTPQSIQDINHYLYLQTKNIADPVARRDALQTKQFFKNWVEKVFKGSKNLNKDYAVFMDTIEAPEHGANLGMTAKGRQSVEAERFLSAAETRHQAAQAELARAEAAYRASHARWEAGDLKSRPATTAYANAVQEAEARQGVLTGLQRGFGEDLRSQVAASTNPDAFVQKWLTSAGQQRLMRLLGPDEGQAFINHLYAMQAQRLGAATPIKGLAPSDEGTRFYRQMGSSRRAVAQDAYRNAYAQRLRDDIATGRVTPQDIINAPTVIRHMQDVFGRERAGAFIGELLTQEAARQGALLPANAAASHPATQFFRQLRDAGLDRQADAFRRAWAQGVQASLEQASSKNAAGVNRIVDKLLTQGGKAQIMEMFPGGEGRKFIEALYNKQQQAGLSGTLFGGPDTAYKMARLEKRGNVREAASNLATGHFAKLMQNLHNMVSGAYEQRVADQANRLFAQQGPADVSRVIDAVLGAERLRTSTDPWIRNPAVRMVGPAGAEANSLLDEFYGPRGIANRRR